MKSINLALQGGGSHGAFTWGALDALLADGRVRIEGISGTSAGAVNAVALAHGFAQKPHDETGGREAARASMRRMWAEIVRLGSLETLQQNLSNIFWPGIPKEFAPTNLMANAWSSLASPYQLNPLGINPMHKLLEQEIDFAAISRLELPRVFVSATHVKTGKAEIFTGKKLSAAAVMASACLPMLFQAVEIDGQPYWDGGYSGNPALTPLINACSSADIVLVQINPIKRDAVPKTPHDILDRVNELTFNASLLSQMRTIDFINRLLDDGRLGHETPQHAHLSAYRRVLMHRIDGGQALEHYPASSKVSTNGVMIQKLFELGAQSAKRWLSRNFEALGSQATVNIRRDYLDDMQLGGIEPHAAF